MSKRRVAVSVVSIVAGFGIAYAVGEALWDPVDREWQVTLDEPAVRNLPAMRLASPRHVRAPVFPRLVPNELGEPDRGVGGGSSTDGSTLSVPTTPEPPDTNPAPENTTTVD